MQVEPTCWPFHLSTMAPGLFQFQFQFQLQFRFNSTSIPGRRVPIPASAAQFASLSTAAAPPVQPAGRPKTNGAPKS